MAPKDLKNSKELKSTAQTNADTPEETVDSKNEEAVVKVNEKSKKKKTQASKEKPLKKVKTEVSENDEVIEKNEETAATKTSLSGEQKVVPEKPASKKKKEMEELAEIADSEPKQLLEEKKTSEKVVDEKPDEKINSGNKKGKKKETVLAEVKKISEDVEEKSDEKGNSGTKKDIKKETVSAEEKKIPVDDAEEKPDEKVISGTDKDKKKETVSDEVKKDDVIGVVSQNAVPKEKPAKKETVDYSKLTQVELINVLRDILDAPEDFNDLKAEIDVIKSTFYKKRNEKIEQEKKEFIEGGGMEEEFVAEDDPYENDIRELLRKYKQLRIEQNKQLDQEKEENIKKKYEVIEKIKGLINNEESINKTFNEFHELQREWREIGLVPQSKLKNLWDLYHFHVENFYDYVKINRELRDLDLKKNLEAKINLCESAEELFVEPSIIKAFNMLQKYHEQWREIGPVPRENKDDIWERFKSVTAKINKKHQDFYESRKSEQKKNLEAKTALCEKVEEINSMEMESYRDWDERSRELIELQKVWRTIGFAPKKDNNKIYDRFRTACDEFFNKKREFYSKNKELQQNNLQMKIDLCIQAEALKDSTDWKKTTQDLINIQKQWKEIGPVPRKHSDVVWKRFRAACDFFFEKKSEYFSGVDSEQLDNMKLKEDLIAEVEKFKSKGNVDENLRTLKDFQRRWTEIGHVPFKKKDDMQNRFRDGINKLFDELNIDDDKRNLLKFKSKMANFSESNRGQNKMRMERDKYMNKLKQLENDLVLLDNNVGFFAKSKNAESLIADVENKIELTKQKIESLKEKIRVIDELDN